MLTLTSTVPVTETSGTLSAMVATTCPARPAEVSTRSAEPCWVSETTGASDVPPRRSVTPVARIRTTAAPAASVVRVMTTEPVRSWPSTESVTFVPEIRR